MMQFDENAGSIRQRRTKPDRIFLSQAEPITTSFTQNYQWFPTIAFEFRLACLNRGKYLINQLNNQPIIE